MVVVDKNWAIGKGNDLLAKLPKDLGRFKAVTIEQFIIIGRKTLESFPGGKPLPNRENIVLTRDKNYINDDVTIVHSVDEILDLVNLHQASNSENEFIVSGGGEIYKLLLPYTSEVLATKIDYSFEGADTYFENLDDDENWLVDPLSKEIIDNGYSTQVFRYTSQR